MQQLNEGLDYMDMEHQIIPTVGVDVYKSKIGSDDELATINFTVKSKAVGDDLVEWMERGYDWILDADVSPGEVANSRWLVFIETNRRTWLPERVYELVADLETLTGLKPEDWRIKVDDKSYPFSADVIKNNIPLSPQDYREKQDDGLNEWREIAGISTTQVYDTKDESIKEIQRQAGIL